ncbi:MAG: Transcriptional regulator, AcrR family, partial [uncultured Actinomycetospora sp.]
DHHDRAGRPHLAAAGGQVRGASSPARRRRPADAVRARVRADEPARDRAELGVLARGAALLLPRQGRPHHLLRAAVQGALRAALRRHRRHRRHPGRPAPRRRRRPRGDAGAGRAAAPPLVRPARPVAVRGVVPRRRGRDRRQPRADDLAHRRGVRRAGRRAAGVHAGVRLRHRRRPVPAGPAAPPRRRARRPRRPARRRPSPAPDARRRV